MQIGKSFLNRRVYLFLGVLVLLICGILLFSGFQQEHVLVSGESSFSRLGSFSSAKDSELAKSFKPAGIQDQEIILWSSRTSSDHSTGHGNLISSPFSAPALLGLFVAGYPNAPGNKLFIERSDTHEKLRLDAGEPGDGWLEMRWLIPSDWRNQPIQVGAIDGANGLTRNWVGISSPLKANPIRLLGTQIPSLVTLPIYFIHFLLFFSPSLFLSTFIIKKKKLNQSFTVILAVTINALIAYLTFWGYVLNKYLGISLSILILLAGIYFLTSRKLKLRLGFKLNKDIIFPISITFLVGLFYLLFLSIFNSYEPSPETLVRSIFFHGFPNDNSLPRLFAEKLYAGRDPRDLGAGWLSSDRPPLQAGLTLVQRPIMVFGAKYLHYQILATIAQCSWVASVWALGRTLKFSGRRIGLLLAFCIFSGFFLFNSLFVWPKLLAAAFTIFAFTLFLQAHQ
ncbi:MAG: hypothetical protein WCA35_28040, partial [Kovacikia sp.]